MVLPLVVVAHRAHRAHLELALHLSEHDGQVLDGAEHGQHAHDRVVRHARPHVGVAAWSSRTRAGFALFVSPNTSRTLIGRSMPSTRSPIAEVREGGGHRAVQLVPRDRVLALRDQHAARREVVEAALRRGPAAGRRSPRPRAGPARGPGTPRCMRAWPPGWPRTVPAGRGCPRARRRFAAVGNLASSRLNCLVTPLRKLHRLVGHGSPHQSRRRAPGGMSAHPVPSAKWA